MLQAQPRCHQERNPCQRSETVKHSFVAQREANVTRREIRVNGLKPEGQVVVCPVSSSGHQERNPCQRSETNWNTELMRKR